MERDCCEEGAREYDGRGREEKEDWKAGSGVLGRGPDGEGVRRGGSEVVWRVVRNGAEVGE